MTESNKPEPEMNLSFGDDGIRIERDGFVTVYEPIAGTFTVWRVGAPELAATLTDATIKHMIMTCPCCLDRLVASAALNGLSAFNR